MEVAAFHQFLGLHFLVRALGSCHISVQITYLLSPSDPVQINLIPQPCEEKMEVEFLCSHAGNKAIRTCMATGAAWERGQQSVWNGSAFPNEKSGRQRRQASHADVIAGQSRGPRPAFSLLSLGGLFTGPRTPPVPPLHRGSVWWVVNEMVIINYDIYWLWVEVWPHKNSYAEAVTPRTSTLHPT
jgi:hypothetical protein